MKSICSVFAGASLLHAVASWNDNGGVTSTTLPECSGTVSVIVETPLLGGICGTNTKPTTIPTQSTTTASSTSGIPSPTPTIGGPCLANVLCRPLGFNVEYYSNQLGGYSSERGVLSNYYIVDRLKPLASSLTNVTYFPQDDFATTPALYPNASLPDEPYLPGYQRQTNGGIVVDANIFTLVYSGLYKAPLTGAFQLCTTADTENDVYFGHGNAFSCITDQPGTAADPLVMSTGGNSISGLNCAVFVALWETTKVLQSST